MYLNATCHHEFRLKFGKTLKNGCFSTKIHRLKQSLRSYLRFFYIITKDQKRVKFEKSLFFFKICFLKSIFSQKNKPTLAHITGKITSIPYKKPKNKEFLF